MTVTNRKERICKSFGSKALSYDEHAQLQEAVAQALALSLPKSMPHKILEIGCGTGILTAHLLKLYPKSTFHITDISPEMLAECEKKFPPCSRLKYARIDGENIALNHTYDLIISSMTVQWFQDPSAALRQMERFLNPAGAIYYTTIGQGSFPEWRSALTAMRAPSGLLDTNNLPHIFDQKDITIQYQNGWDFLQSLKQTGASQPNPDYAPMHPVLLKKVCAYFDQYYQGRTTWKIAFGCIKPLHKE